MSESKWIRPECLDLVHEEIVEPERRMLVVRAADPAGLDTQQGVVRSDLRKREAAQLACDTPSFVLPSLRAASQRSSQTGRLP